MPPDNGQQRYVICNADESEPGAFKDREILATNPHQVIEGMLIAAYVMGASVGYFYLRGEFRYEAYARLEQALAEAMKHNLMGDDILGSGLAIHLHAILGAGAYICGEETALMESLEGKKGWPRFKPPFPANYGLFGAPTNINNVETYASIPVILEKGGAWFASIGTPKSGGTKIFSVSGHVERPGNYELPLGTPFKILLDLAGGVWKKRQLKAVIPGGSSTPVVPAHVILETALDYESLRSAGSMLGSGSIIVLDDTVDMPQLLERMALFYHRESCGQCTPCREGTGWIWRLLQRLNKAQADHHDLETLKRLCHQIPGTTICALADSITGPVESFLQHFWPEFEAKIIPARSPLI
jgi:NADH-quinone oxidoreductase subunit F